MVLGGCFVPHVQIYCFSSMKNDKQGRRMILHFVELRHSPSFSAANKFGEKRLEIA